ncbi:MAG: hypothetical protein AAFR47_19525 [Pseudomonadota bacterium]
MPGSSLTYFVCDPAAHVRRDLDLDSFETSVLTVSRHVFETLERPEDQCWMSAFWHAEQAFPPPFGATIAHALVIAINASRTSRRRSFSYLRVSDPLADVSITDEERYYVMALRGIREGDNSCARLNALFLCEGHSADALLAALERLALITGDVTEPRLQPTR